MRRTSVACREADSSQSIALWVDGDLWSFPSPLFGSKLSIFSVAGGHDEPWNALVSLELFGRDPDTTR